MREDPGDFNNQAGTCHLFIFGGVFFFILNI